MNKGNDIKGFFSYARQNDKHGGGNLSLLRNSLEIELWEQIGEAIKIFQDQEDIEWGEFWEKKISTSLNSSKFLIAIITPGYLKSKACRFELEFFLNVEKSIGSERILPIIYIETPELKNTKDPIFSEINNRQWFDWTNLRFSSLESISSKKKLEKLVRRIRDLIADEISPQNNSETNYNFPNSVVSTTISDKSLLHNTTLSSELDQNHEKKIEPPPDNFPDGWNTEWQTSFDRSTVVAKSEPKFKDEKDGTSPSLDIPKPIISQGAYEEKPPQQITITLQATGDSERDRRRIKTLYGTLNSYHGKDKFSFQVFDNGKGHLIDFPNNTTRICPELLSRLKILMKEEAWRVEPITFQ